MSEDDAGVSAATAGRRPDFNCNGSPLRAIDRKQSPSILADLSSCWRPYEVQEARRWRSGRNPSRSMSTAGTWAYRSMTRPTHTTAVTWSSPTPRATLRLVALLDVGLRHLHSLQDRLPRGEGH